MIPRVLGVNLGVNFFGESQDPVVVFNAILPAEVLGEQLAFHGGVPDQCVVPLAFAPEDLQALVPQIVDSVIRSRSIMEMLTIWPDHRDEIIRNILFRWTGQITGEDGDGTT